jgi:alpha-L-fucosidase
MYDSKLTDWDIIDRTPFRRDVIGEMAVACRREKLPLFLYYSQLDWHHPDYFPRGGTGRKSGRPESGDFNRYRAYMDGQLEELLTRYGAVAGVWLDGMWDNGAVDWQLPRTYAMIKRLQPWALIGSNHNNKPHPGEDFIPFEAYVRPENVPPDGDYPLEVAEKINDTWGYRIHDRLYKSGSDLVRNLVKAAGAGANYLINVGPMADGTIQPEFVERLSYVGDWLRRYGRSIYGTRAGPIAARPWGVTTLRGDTMFVHVLDWKDALLPIGGLGRRVISGRYVGRPGSPTLSVMPGGVVLGIEPPAPDDVDVVIELVLAKP